MIVAAGLEKPHIKFLIMENAENVSKYALITGATSGFGYEFAYLLAHHGYNLILVARQQNSLDEIARSIHAEYNVNVVTIAKDLFKPKSAEEVYLEVKDKGLFVDVLINDAGQGEYGKF